MALSDAAVSIRLATPTDCAAVACLYSGYVQGSLATFELVPPTADDWQAKLAELNRLGLPFLVALHGGEVAGYALATPWRPRPGYRFTVEDSIYVQPERIGQGLGSQLMTALIAALRSWGAKQMIAVIVDSGEPISAAFHRSAGFVEVGRLHQVGYKQGRWLDTLLLQLSLEDGPG